MEGVWAVEVFHAEVVDAECESCSFCFVSPEAWREWHGFVSMRGQVFNQVVKSDDSGFFEAVHASLNFEINIAIVGYVYVVIRVILDFLWDDGWVHSHVLVIVHGSAEVVVLDVEAEVSCSVLGVRDGAADVDLGIWHGDGGGTSVSGVI